MASYIYIPNDIYSMRLRYEQLDEFDCCCPFAQIDQVGEHSTTDDCLLLAYRIEID